MGEWIPSFESKEAASGFVESVELLTKYINEFEEQRQKVKNLEAEIMFLKGKVDGLISSR